MKTEDKRIQALEGVKVLDFGWALAGSLNTKHLADHGAQVIRLETAKRQCMTRTNRQVSISSRTNPDDKPFFLHYNTSKYSLTLDIKHPRAREVLDRLIQWADVVNENFMPGTLTKLGLGYEDIQKIKPDIIMVSTSIFGQTGPYAHMGGVDGMGNAISGRLDLSGWPDRGPVSPSSCAFGDDILPLFTAMAIVAALDYRRKTGKGQYIDGAMLEVCANQIGPAFLDWQANGRIQTRNGNRIHEASPHGVFPCKGDDRWCAISVFTDEEWKAFCGVLGSPPWTKEERFRDLASRRTNEDELELFIAEWTSERDPQEVMRLMQKAGVCAGIVQDARDLMENDPQLKERNFLLNLKHPVLGVCAHPTPPYKLLKTPAQVKTAPCLGEHNDFICTRILGMPDEKFVELLQEGVFQ
ncbi:MAG: CoA transferase [Deltaproteobacteria bacterium]|nr:CoA transferase [Deltaproteobacteria bacterium]